MLHNYVIFIYKYANRTYRRTVPAYQVYHTILKMTRGYSLEQDLRLLINNPKYSDIEILCEDEKKLYGCRAILGTRSEVFDGLLYNGMKESYEKQISFPEIHSSVMKIILEYTYIVSVH